MTPKQRATHTASIKQILLISGFTKDFYGNYKITFNSREYRLKFKAINLRFERKSGSTWHKIFSKPASQIDLADLAIYLSKFTSQAI